MIREKKWAGLDLAPLPYESLESAALRFAWSNALRARELRQLIGVDRVYFRVDCAKLEQQTGWFLLMRQDCVADVDTIKGRSENYWQAKAFRYCPICFEAMYHSFLFQYEDLHTCPIHNVLLQCRCLHCGAWAPTLRTLFADPYRCSKCREYLCGATPTIDEHFALRGTEAMIERQLKPLQRWSTEGQARRKEATFVMQVSSRAMHTQGQKRQAQIAREFARETHAKEVLSVASERVCLHDYVCLRWNYRIALDAAGYDISAKNGHQRTAFETVQTVYRCVLRALDRWLAHAGPPCQQPAADHQNQVWGHWQIARHAYMLFRSHLEHSFERAGRRVFVNAREARMLRIPELGITEYASRAPRLAWRAALLACYSYWYYFSRSPVNHFRLPYASPERGNLLLYGGPDGPREPGEQGALSERANPEHERRFAGCVWLRRIPGWDYPTPRSDSASRELIG